MMPKTVAQYRTHVEERLSAFTKILAKISVGDYGERVDIEKLPQDEFLNVYVGLELLMDDLQETRQVLEDEASRSALRVEIWRVSGDRSLGDEELVHRLLSMAGAFFGVARASFFELAPDDDCAECKIQWCNREFGSSIGLRIPQSIVQRFSLSAGYAVVQRESLATEVVDALGPLFGDFAIGSFLAYPTPSTETMQGFFAFSHADEKRIWKPEEIDILGEIVNIITLRSASRKAEEEMRTANERLEAQVKKRTGELRAANDQLLRDIEGRRRSEAALAESERFLNSIFVSIQDGISVLDKDLNIIRVNPTMERLYPHSLPLIGKKCFAAYHGRTESCETCPTRQTLLSGKAAYEIVPRRASNGQVTGWLDLYAFPLMDPLTGQLRGVIEYVRDITEKKKAEKELAEEKKLLDVTLRSINEGVISTDKDGRIVLMNPVAEALTGWKLREATGMPIEQVVRLLDADSHAPVSAPFRKVMDTGIPVTSHLPRAIVSKEGSERIVFHSAAPIRDDHGTLTGVACVIRDVTDQQRMEQEIFKAAKLESLGLLAGGIAHDFNNILTGIVTNLFMAKMNVGGNEDVKQLIMDAEKAAFRASRLTKQLLTFSKGGSPVKESVSLRSVVEDSVGFCLSGSNSDYRLEFGDDLWPVEVDRGQIDQVINNLVINADQAMPNGGTILVRTENFEINDRIPSGTATALPLKPGRYVKVLVKDEGIGIPPKDLARIFDPYYTTKQNGSGLGLTTAFSIIKKHGGHVTASSILGKGSTFSFFVPAAIVDSGVAAGEEERLRQGTQRVLVMDDDEIVRMVVQRLLTTHGYSVECTSHGQAAIDAYKKALDESSRFDIVIMDLTVPGGLGGREASRKIFEIDPDARIVVFSGYSNDPIMSNYQEFGFVGVLAKPFSIDEFSRLLNRIMHGSPAVPAPSK